MHSSCNRKHTQGCRGNAVSMMDEMCAFLGAVVRTRTCLDVRQNTDLSDMELTYRLGRDIHQRGRGLELEYRRDRPRSPEANRGVIP